MASRLTKSSNLTHWLISTQVLTDDGTSVVTKAAIEPVWYLPGVAKRFGVSERVLRDALFAETNSMYPELISRDDLKIFLPPIGGMTVPARVEIILRVTAIASMASGA